VFEWVVWRATDKSNGSLQGAGASAPAVKLKMVGWLRQVQLNEDSVRSASSEFHKITLSRKRAWMGLWADIRAK